MDLQAGRAGFRPTEAASASHGAYRQSLCGAPSCGYGERSRWQSRSTVWAVPFTFA